MIHKSVLYLYVQILKYIFNVEFTDIDGTSINLGNPFYDTLITISYIFIAVIVASFMYTYIETKFRRKN